jgi:glucosamine--fructose-6-phosphate aminotransferase (isomerizing)
MSILEQEIHEQPQVLRRLIETETDNVSRLVTEIKGTFNYVVMAARGSSDNAARYAQYLFGVRNRLPVSLATPSLYTLYKCPPMLTGALVIGVSQSGQSPDIVSVIQTGRAQGQPTLAITNDPDSPLAQAADYQVLLHSGLERAVAASKTYTASLTAMALLSAILSGASEDLEALRLIPELVEQTIANVIPGLERVERYRYMAHCVVIGRGFNYATAFEIALKIKELTQTVAEPYSSADFRHGPVAMVRDGFPVILVSPTGSVFEDLENLANKLESLGSELLIISDDAGFLKRACLSFPIPPGVPEYLTPMLAVIPGQLFSLSLALAKNLNPDQPVGLRKVTETL